MPERPVFNAERVADQLEAVQSQVDGAITSSWTVDEALDRATESLTEESVRCRDAEHQVKRVRRSAAIFVGSTITGSIGIAFAMMVLADLAKAMLDTAANGAIVAAAYVAARDEE